MGQLARLEDLKLFENPLVGSIQSDLGNLSNLRRLCLFFTHLTGTIPPRINGTLSNLNGNMLDRIGGQWTSS